MIKFENRTELDTVFRKLESSFLMFAKYRETCNTYISVSDFISGLNDEDLKDIAKKANRYIKSLDVTISNEEELLNLINNKNIIRKILGQ